MYGSVDDLGLPLIYNHDKYFDLGAKCFISVCVYLNCGHECSRDIDRMGAKQGSCQREEADSLCLVFSFGCFHFFRLDAFMWKSPACAGHAPHAPSTIRLLRHSMGFRQIPFELNCLYRPQNRNENKCFFAFFRHANTIAFKYRS